MAQQTTIRLVDDLDGSDAVEIVQFALDGRHFEIDLSASHALALRGNLADYVAHVRRAARARAAKPTATAGRVPARAARAQTAAIRAWAKDNGHEIADRGRVPKTVIAAFHAAH